MAPMVLDKPVDVDVAVGVLEDIECDMVKLDAAEPLLH